MNKILKIDMTSGQNPSISYLGEQTKNEKNDKYIYKT